MAGKLARNVPVVMQMEAAECGAACLDMILAYYGRWVPLETVRTDCGIGRDGSKSENILEAARRYGLDAKSDKYATVEELQSAGTFPCIVGWGASHFVVLRGFRGGSVYLNDPKRGAVKVSREEFERSYSGETMEMTPTSSFQKGGKRASTLDFARKRLEGMKAPIVFVALAMFVLSLAAIASTSASSVFMDFVLSGDNPQWLAPLLVLLGTLVVLQCAVNIANAVYLNRIRGKFAVLGASEFIWHLLHLPVSFYDQRMVGDLQQRQEDNETIAATLVEQLAPALFNSVLLVLYLVVMLGYSWKLTLVGIVTVALNTFAANRVSRARVNVARQQARDKGLFYSSTIAGIESIETVKASGAEDAYFERWAGYQALVNDVNVQFSKIDLYFGSIPQFLTNLANMVVLVVGTSLIMSGELTAGMLLAFQGLIANFMGPVDSIIGLGQNIQEMRTSMERVQDVLEYPVDVDKVTGAEIGGPSSRMAGADTDAQTADQDTTSVAAIGNNACDETIAGTAPGAAGANPKAAASSNSDEEMATEHAAFSRKLSGNIEIDRITFGYSPLEPPLIKDFSLTLKQGEWVAFVGSSGSGKSTIAKLVSGLFKPWSGEVRFDGIPRAQIPPEQMHGSLAVVDQSIVTFADTVDANIRLWDRSIEEYEIMLAARDADIHDDIMDRDLGYRERIAPGGKNYSGGQLQRMEIARALAIDPSIIILDEATSALDAKTEAHVIQAIRNRGITCIVVAHRLSTIRDCDEIIVLDQGAVVERGTHAELMALEGAYANLVRSN